jgi:DNA-binding transcriptional MerR regulator
MSDYISKNIKKLAEELSLDKKRSIGEVAKELKIPTHVIRFWESKFSQIKPELGRGKRRYYYQKDLEILKKIKKFLYEQGYTISGLQKLLKSRQNSQAQKEDIDLILSKAYENEAHQQELIFDKQYFKKEEGSLEEAELNSEGSNNQNALNQFNIFIDPSKKIIIDNINLLSEIKENIEEIIIDIRKKLAHLLSFFDDVS